MVQIGTKWQEDAYDYVEVPAYAYTASCAVYAFNELTNAFEDNLRELGKMEKDTVYGQYLLLKCDRFNEVVVDNSKLMAYFPFMADVMHYCEEYDANTHASYWELPDIAEDEEEADHKVLALCSLASNTGERMHVMERYWHIVRHNVSKFFQWEDLPF